MTTNKSINEQLDEVFGKANPPKDPTEERINFLLHQVKKLRDRVRFLELVCILMILVMIINLAIRILLICC